MTEAALAGPKILLIGGGGAGKTYSLGTLVDWAEREGKTVAALFTENGLETLLGYWRDERPGKTPREIPKCLHWRTTLTKPLSLSSLMKAADNVGKLSYEAITKMTDASRSENNAFYKILATCNDFVSDRTGEKFGAVDSFGPDKVFILDSLTELSNACMKMVIGSKPTAAPPDYGVAQNNLMNFLRLLTQGLACTVVMTGHISREKDEITGGTKLTVSAVGSALGPQIPPLFSDVIMSVREGDKFYWDTVAYGADLKTRSLPYASKLPPDFATIMDVWKKRGGK